MSEPVFDRSGKYLYFFGSTDAGPVHDWFAQSNADMRATRSIYLVVLRKDLPSPLARESDEEKGAKAETDAERSRDGRREAGGDKPTSKPAAPTLRRAEPFRIDFDGIEYRILDLPVPAARSVEPAGRHRRPALLPARRPTSKTVAPALRPQDAEGRDRAARRRRLRASRPTARSCCTRRDELVDRGDDDEGRAERRADRRRTRSRSRSTRAPSGRRSSTRPGGSTATTSTPRTCTAWTGRR